jgi:hypothetical protein
VLLAGIVPGFQAFDRFCHDTPPKFPTRLCHSGLTKPQDIPDAILWLLMNA